MKSMKLIDTGWPIIELGYGRIEVADGTHEGKPALIFGRNGMGKIGEPTQPDRRHEPGETLAVITFANIESLDVVADELAQIRALLAGPAQETRCEHGVKSPFTCEHCVSALNRETAP